MNKSYIKLYNDEFNYQYFFYNEKKFQKLTNIAMTQLDKLDCNILNILQTDATTPLKVLADELGSSVTTCQRRIQRMRDEGVIIKEVALVNPIAVGRGLSVFVSVIMQTQNLAKIDSFTHQMGKEDDVVSCYEISGDFDFILLVHAKDMMAYHHFTRRVMTEEYNVGNYKSEFVMNFKKVNTKIHL